MSKERKRIAKACDLCRKKKIKCNGASPCLNCTNYNNICLYTYIGKRDVSKIDKFKSPAKGKTLESRIDKIEQMIGMLVNKLDGNSDINLNIEEDEDDVEGQDDGQEDDEDIEEEHASIMPSDYKYNGTEKTGAKTLHGQKMSILSEKGLAWLESKTSAETSSPFLNIIKSYAPTVAELENIWINNKQPTAPSLTHGQLFYIVKYFLRRFQIVTFYEDDFFNTAFQKHYLEKELTDTEYLTVYSILLLSIASLKTLPFDPILNITNEQLSYLESTLYNNCIYHFYRVSCFRQDVSTVQALIIFLSYMNNPMYHNNQYMILSTAITAAKNLHLNSASNSNPQGCKIWWYLYYLDREFSFRYGKFPIISDIDNRTEIPHKFQVCLNGKLNENGEDECLRRLVLISGFEVFFHYYSLQLSKITSKIIMSNYSDASDSHIQKLDTELETFRQSFDISVRPGEAFLFHDDYQNHQVLSLHLSYWYTKMTLNTRYLKDENSYGYNQCIESAKMILELSKKINLTNFIHWNLFYTTSAFTVVFYKASIKISKVKSSSTVSNEVHSDVELLFEVAIKAFKGKYRFLESLINQLVRRLLVLFEESDSRITEVDLSECYKKIGFCMSSNGDSSATDKFSHNEGDPFIEQQMFCLPSNLFDCCVL